MENKFIILAKDCETGEEKIIEKFDSDGWIKTSVDETEDIDFEEFCDFVKSWVDAIGDI